MVEIHKNPFIVKIVDKVMPYYRERLYRNSLYFILRTVLTSLLGFFFWLIVARLYSEIEVGYSSAIISAVNLLVMIALIGLSPALVRFLPASAKPRELINSAFTLVGLVGFVVTAIFLVGLPFWAPGLKFITDNVIFTLTFLGTVVFATLSDLSNGVFIAARRAVFTFIKDCTASLLKILCAVGFSISFHSFGITASWGISLGIGVTFALMLFIPKIHFDYKVWPTLNRGFIGKMWAYSGANYLASLLSSAPALIFPLLVLNLAGVRNNAYFYIAWMIANLLNAVPYSVAQSFFAESTNFPDNQTVMRNLKNSLKLVYRLVIPAAIVLLAASQWLLLAFGESYVNNALMLLRLLILASLFIGFTEVYISILKARDKLKELLIIRGLSSLIILVLGFLLVPVSGIVAIGYTLLGVQAVTALILGLRLYNSIKKHSE